MAHHGTGWSGTLAAAFALALPGSADAQQKRPMTWSDMQELRFVSSPSLSPDGKRLVYHLEVPDWRKASNQSDVYVVSTDAGVASTKRLTLTDDKREARPAWTPDGRHIVFAANPDGPSQLYIIHPDSAGAHRKFTNAPASVGTFEFSPDGRWLVYHSGRTATDRQLFAVAVAEIVGGGVPAARQLTKHPTGVANWRFAPDGSRIYFTNGSAVDSLEAARREARFTVDVQDPAVPVVGLWAVDVPSGTTRPIVRDSTITIGDVALSRDGRWLAYRALPNDRIKRNAGPESVMYGDNYLLHIESGRVERITNNEELPETPVSFSPDSRWIAYGAAREGAKFTGNRRVYLRRVDQANASWRALGTDFDGPVGLDGWSPDSRTIYFDAGSGATVQLFALDVASGKVRQLTSAKGVVSLLPIRDASHPVVLLHQDPMTPPSAFAARSVADLDDQAKWVRVTHANPQVDNIALGETSEITWTSKDGTKVGGVLVKPVGYEPGRRYPLLVVLHGGPHAAETMTFNGDDNDGPQVYAGMGYMVLAPNYRGSTGYGEAFTRGLIGNYNSLAFEDVMSGVDHLIGRGMVDSTQMGVAGHSAGGSLGNWILVQTSRFKAISTGAGVVNWISMYGTSDFQRPREEWFGGAPYGNFDAYWNQSPLKYITNAKTPTLIYSTEGDPRVPSGQARELYTALRRLGVTAELHMYPGTQHGVPGPANRIAHGMAEQAWMDHHVRGRSRSSIWKDVLAVKSGSGAISSASAEVVGAVLRAYAGEYEVAPGRTITVTLEGTQLFGQPTGQAKAPLVSIDERTFWVGRSGATTRVRFTTDASGAVVGMDMLQGGNVRAGRKVR